MEDEKKKKKNRKKKGKQTKTLEDVELSVGEPTSMEQNDIIMQNNHIQASGAGDSSTDGVLETHGNLDGYHPQKVILEEKVRELQNERDSCMQREVILEEKLRELQNERDSCMQREVDLEDKIIHLQNEKDSRVQKEESLEEKIKKLMNEKSFWISKTVSLEEKIKQLEGDKESWVLKEDSTNVLIARINEEKIGLRKQVEELEESRSILSQENQQLVENISVLQLQIQRAKGEAFSASSTTETAKYASTEKDPNTQMEAAYALVDKLIRENAELVEKVNELYIELNQQSVTAVPSSTIGFNTAVGIAEAVSVADVKSGFSEELSESGKRLEPSANIQGTDESTSVDNAETKSSLITQNQIQEQQVIYGAAEYKSGFSEGLSEVGKRLEPLASVQGKDKSTGDDNVERESTQLTLNQIEEPLVSYGAGDTEEIVQVPLNENEVHELESQVLEADDEAVVPLSDAPIIGAPFRLISFFANYVSGADLVNKTGQV